MIIKIRIDYQISQFQLQHPNSRINIANVFVGIVITSAGILFM